MKRHDWPAAPTVLGPLFETALRQSLTLSHGSAAIFVTRPISAALLAAALAAVAAPALLHMARPRRAPSGA